MALIPIVISNNLRIPCDIVGPLWHEICQRLTFPNPRWEENNKYGRWQGDTAKFIQCWDTDGSDYYLPRGFIPQLLTILKAQGYSYRLIDQRRFCKPVSFVFHGKLNLFQEKAAKAILAKDFATLAAPTGSGKTVIALYTITQRAQPTLVIVHTKELLYQWSERIATFLDIDRAQIGQIGDGKFSIGSRITVAIINSLYPRVNAVKNHTGFLVVDECHRIPARIFTETVKAFDSRYMLGLSATPYRRDKLSKLIYYYVGNVYYQISQRELENSWVILKPEIVTRITSFDFPYSEPKDYQTMLQALVTDKQRNSLIVNDIVQEARSNDYTLLALSDRKEHCYMLQQYLAKRGISSAVLVGDLPKLKRQEILSHLNEGKVKVLLATGQLIGEGFDSKRLSALFLCTPIKFTGRVRQYLGRVLRTNGNKRAKVYDYLDIKVGILRAAFKSRQQVYLDRVA